MFLHLSISHSVHSGGEGGSPGPHPGGRLGGLAGEGGFQAHTQGGRLGGLAGGGCPGPHLGGVQAHTGGGPGPGWGDVSQHALRQTPLSTPPPPSRWLLLWAVCILLECILVSRTFSLTFETDFLL